MTLLAVAVGGALGAVSRYLASGWVQDLAGGSFPWGTFAVNMAGSLLLGITWVWLQSVTASAELRGFITVGILGSFTTFSTFSLEGLVLVRDGEWLRAGVYMAGSVAVGLAAVALGVALATAFVSDGAPA